MIRRKVPWTSQPQSPATPNPNLSIKNLYQGSMPGFDAVTSISSSLIGSASYSPGQNGLELLLPGSGSSVNLNAVTLLPTSNSFSCAVQFRLNGAQTDLSGIVTSAQFNANSGWMLVARSSGAVSFYIRKDAATWVAISTSPLSAGYHTVVCAWTGAVMKLVVDGVKTEIACTSMYAPAPNKTARLGDYNVTYAKVNIVNVAFSESAWDSGLASNISRNIFDIFAPQERRVFVRIAGGATVLDLTAATLNLTPQSTQNVLTASLTAGALSFTPQDTQSTLAASLSAGALSFTPQDTQNTLVTTLSVGALNFTPQDITAQNGTAPVIVSLDVGTFSFTPQGIQSLNTLNLANATFSNTALDLRIVLTANLAAYALNATPQSPQIMTINNLSSSTFNFTPYPIGATGAVTADAGASKMLMGVGY